MIERLLEVWLDNINEKGYQPVFLQILAHEGYTILHNTRHSPLEFGKDVIAIASDGQLHAFQLKGNPGGHLTQAQLLQLQPQLLQLVTQAIAHPGAPNVRHISFLVTNGEIDEAAHRALHDLNQMFEQLGFGKDALRVYSRGHLLERITTLGSAAWPLRLGDYSTLFDLLSFDGREMLPLEKIDQLLSTVFALRDNDDPLSAPEITRRTAAAGILLAIALQNFYAQENHYAILSAWVLFISYAVSAHVRWKIDMQGGSLESIASAENTIFAHLSSLAKELRDNERAIEGDIVTDFEFVCARKGLLYALLSVLWFWCQRREGTSEITSLVEHVLPRTFTPRSLWGEGAIPQLLLHYWYISEKSGGSHPERQLAEILSLIVSTQQTGGSSALPSPYYSYDQIIRKRYADFIRCPDPIGEDSFHGSSWMAAALFQLAVRANLKQTCKVIWPELTKLVANEYEVGLPWQFGLIRSSIGIQRSVLPNPTTSWQDAQRAAARCDIRLVPRYLRDRPLLLALLVVVLPHRATTDVVKFLDSTLSRIWFMPFPRLFV